MGKNDIRYRKTEKRILSALSGLIFKKPRTISIKPISLARESGISTSTLYRHYKVIDNIVSSHERRLLRDFHIRYNKIKKRATLDQSVQCVLFFIALNQDYFRLAFRQNDKHVFNLMMKSLKPKICRFSKISSKSDKIIAIYNSEIYEIIAKWGNNGFKIDDFNYIKKDILYLTSTIKTRLSPIDGC